MCHTEEYLMNITKVNFSIKPLNVVYSFVTNLQVSKSFEDTPTYFQNLFHKGEVNSFSRLRPAQLGLAFREQNQENEKEFNLMLAK